MIWQSIIVWTAISVVVAASGVLYSWVFYGGFLQGGVYALVVCLPIIAFERGLLLDGIRRWMIDLPFWGYVASALFLYTAFIMTGFFIAGTVMWYFALVTGPWSEQAVPHFVALIYRILVALSIIAILRVRDLIGRQRFFNLILGRYRRPTVEQRIFLFVDLVGSTTYAERHGDLRLMELLSSLFSAIADPVQRNGGTIDDYIGDGVLISWPMQTGLDRAQCVRCIFEILEMIDRDAVRWVKKFGRAPDLRAALHGGEIITAEVGSDHHKITYFGDTINTAARLEAMCREMQEQVLISTNLADRMTMPDHVSVEPRGRRPIRGKQMELDISALRFVAPLVPRVGQPALIGTAPFSPSQT